MSSEYSVYGYLKIVTLAFGFKYARRAVGLVAWDETAKLLFYFFRMSLRLISGHSIASNGTGGMPVFFPTLSRHLGRYCHENASREVS